jgi:hypothetical protein
VKGSRKQTVLTKERVEVFEGVSERHDLTSRRLKGSAVWEGRRRESEDEVWKHFSHGKRPHGKAVDRE